MFHCKLSLVQSLVIVIVDLHSILNFIKTLLMGEGQVITLVKINNASMSCQ